MEDIIAEVKRVYIEEITTLLAPRIVFISVFYLICISVWTAQEGVWQNLLSYSVFSLFDLVSGPISTILVRDLLISVIGALTTNYFYRTLKESWFNSVAKKLNFEARINGSIRNAEHIKSDNEAYNLFMVKDYQKEIENKEKTVYRYHIFGRLAITIATGSLTSFLFSFFVSVSSGRIVLCYFDLFAFAIAVVFIFFVQEKSIVYFLKEVMPLIVIEKALLGKSYELN